MNPQITDLGSGAQFASSAPFSAFGVAVTYDQLSVRWFYLRIETVGDVGGSSELSLQSAAE